MRILSLFCFILFITSPVYSQPATDIKRLLSSEGKIVFGNEPNSIMVIDYPENIQRIAEYLEVMDVPSPQVLIEARVVEVRLQGEHSLGINWSLFAEKGGLEVGQFRIYSVPGGPIEQAIPYKPTYMPPGQKAAGQEAPFTVTIFDENISLVLRTLANSLETNILSAPRITTVNNQKAEIKIIQKIPWAEPEVQMSEVGIAITWEVKFEEVGIILKVTPTISEDNKISLLLEPEISEHVGDYQLRVVQADTEIPYTVPIIDKRSAQTKVVIGDGQTLIIGGLIKERNNKEITKVPLLGDVPFLGWLFKSKKDVRDKTELLIFVSPTIITPEVLTRMTRQEKGHQREEEAKRISELEAKEKREKIQEITLEKISQAQQREASALQEKK